MNFELFFIYDSHCPWSYASTPLVTEIVQHFPNAQLHAWHSAHFQGDIAINAKQIQQVTDTSQVVFSNQYREQLEHYQDSVLVANLMAWVEKKLPDQYLSLLQALQIAHFEHANSLTNADQLNEILQSFHLSPPSKVLNADKLTKDAEYNLLNIIEMQDIIGTQAIPALLLAVDSNLVLLNHNLYLNNPKNIIEAVKIELAKHQ